MWRLPQPPVIRHSDFSAMKETHYRPPLNHKLLELHIPVQFCISALPFLAPMCTGPWCTAAGVRRVYSLPFSLQTAPPPTTSSGPTISVCSPRPAKKKSKKSDNNVKYVKFATRSMIQRTVHYLHVCHFSQKHFLLFHPGVFFLTVTLPELLEPLSQS